MKKTILILTLLLFTAKTYSQTTHLIECVTKGTGGTLITYPVASVFQLVNDQFYYLETVSTQGDTLFISNLDTGKYIIHVFPDTGSLSFNSYLPTYFGDSLNWQHADTMHLTSDTIVSINLQAAPSYVSPDVTWNTGTDTIMGNITVTGDSAARLMAGSVVAPGAVVNLYDNSGQWLTYTYSDASGNYEFTSIASGTYTVKVQYTGMNPITQNLTVNSSTTNASLTVARYTGSSGVTSVAQNNSLQNFNVYPNPVKDILNIGFNSSTDNFQYNLTDVTGKQVKNGSGAGSINISELNKGIYILKIQSDNTVSFAQIIVE